MLFKWHTVRTNSRMKPRDTGDWFAVYFNIVLVFDILCTVFRQKCKWHKHSPSLQWCCVTAVKYSILLWYHIIPSFHDQWNINELHCQTCWQASFISLSAHFLLEYSHCVREIYSHLMQSVGQRTKDATHCTQYCNTSVTTVFCLMSHLLFSTELG